jgi:bzd-type benzoyl-CoA reductase Q subunit
MRRNKAYWKWPEYRRTISRKQWRKARVITAGVDVGSVSSKAAIMVDGELYAYSIMRTGASSPDSANRVMQWALEGTGMKLEDMLYVVGTGYGRVNVPFANKTLTEIACHARGANYMWGPKVRTILDMGGQDCKAIKCDSRGKVETFLMNDKCAAGTGRGIEVLAKLLSIPIEEVGPLSLKVEKEPEPVSSTCAVFAKSEALRLLRKGWPREKVLAAYCLAMTKRVAELLRRIGVEKEFVITGGIAKNIGIVKRLEEELEIESLPLDPKYDPMIAGAVGAAIFAQALLERRKNVSRGRA